jgi:hypothetical protein
MQIISFLLQILINHRILTSDWSAHPISVWVACRGRAVTTTSAEEYELKANIHKYYRTNKVHC